MLQALTDDSYAQFVHDVAQRRPKVASLPKNAWAEGRIVTGRQALELGLVDELGAYAVLQRALRAKAPIEGDILWVHACKPTLLGCLWGTQPDDDVMVTSSFSATPPYKSQSWIKTLLQEILQVFNPS
jgi:ClpP class serine protease